jgi:membrane fusion protein (multidrug efflux system)
MTPSLSETIARRASGYRFAAAVLLLPMLLAFSACGGDEAAGPSVAAVEANRAVPVEVLVVTPAAFEDVIEMTGTVEAPDDATLSAEASGTLTALAPLGTTVQRGGTVAQINATMGQAGLAQAEAALEAAQAQADLAQDQFARQEPLFADSIISAAEFQSVRTQRAATQAQVAQARAAVAQARQQLAYTRVVAPFTGTVEAHFAERGEQVAPGMQVARLVSTENVEVRAGVPERYAADIAVGTNVLIEPTAYGIPAQRGTVTFVGAAIDPQSRTFPIEVRPASAAGALKPAMVVRLAVSRSTLDDALVVPLGAVERDERGPSVFVVAGEAGDLVVERRPVELGASAGGRTVVTAGLQPGDRVIVSGGISEGDLVRIEERTSMSDLAVAE